jgi:uncharacterized protein (DUF433 family)
MERCPARVKADARLRPSRLVPRYTDRQMRSRSMVDVIREHIEIVEGAGGPKARIRGSRIRVQDVAIWHEKLGMSANEIVQDYPQLTLADVHAALAYYWDHRDEIERRLAEEDALVEQMRALYPSPLKQKLERPQRDRGSDSLPPR